MIAALVAIGAPVLAALASIGRLTRFAVTALSRLLQPPWYPAQLAQQMLVIGWLSLPVVGLTAIFTGSALAQQIFIGGSRFNAASTVPAVTVIGVVRELGPVLTAIMITGRAGSSMTAEIGVMRISDQVDALALEPS